MRYRALDSDGDMMFGRAGVFLVDSPEAVAQAVKTRLGLMAGEWFLDINEGLPYTPDVLGTLTQDTRDAAIKTRVLKTLGVTELIDYSSTVDNRAMKVSATVETEYGAAAVENVF